jgi:hypothetical protein
MEMADLERIEMSYDKTEDFQKKYNITTKNFAYILGKNLTLYLCILIPFILIGFVWTEFGPITIGQKFLSDGLLTVTLFVVGEIMMTKLGSDGGKLDAEYIKAKFEYDSLVTKVGEIGSMLIGIFCDWQIDLELKEAVKSRLRVLRMTQTTFDEVKDLPYGELERRYGKYKARKILEIKSLKPIELSEAILLYDDTKTTRGGVPVSAEDFLKSRRYFVETLIACIFTGLLTISVVVTLTQDITFARVVYTMFKLIMLLFRMAKGYDRGARAYNTVAVKQYRARANYLRTYIKFVEDKIYLKLGDKYGAIDCFVGED